VKTRTIRRHRLVPHTVDGETELVLDHYDEQIPVPPRDWDRTILNAVTGGAFLMVTAAIIWSTASIGDLLARAVIAPAAYGAAAVFDLAWIMCMAVEWLARYDPQRAALPRNAGHVALVVAMAAVGAHGWIADQVAIGLIGAAVSGIAKGGWTVVLRHHAKPLDDRTQQWVDKRRAAAGGRLAMVAVNRELQRAQALVAAEAAALSAGNPESPEADPDDPDARPEDPDATVLPLASGPMSRAEAVRTAMDCGIHDPDAVLRYVRKVADSEAKPETIARYIRDLRKAAP